VTELAEILRQRLEPYAYPNSFSFAFDTKRADLQCIVENGKTVAVRLTPARRTLVMAFVGRRTGVRVSLKVEETTWEAIVETVMSTVESLLQKGT
jgi:hypothetical protein